jgi:hypothetical protein
MVKLGNEGIAAGPRPQLKADLLDLPPEEMPISGSQIARRSEVE